MSRFRLLLFMSLQAITASAQSPQAREPLPGAPAGITAFVDVAVVPMDSERVLPHQTVLVQGGRITALGPKDQIQVPAGAVQIDGQNKYLMPGLADMSADIADGLPQLGFDSAGVERRLFLWVANGITTVRHMVPSFSSPRGDNERYKRLRAEVINGPAILRLRARAAAGELWSPRIYASAPLGDSTKLPPLSPSEIGPAVTAYKAAGYDFISITMDWNFRWYNNAPADRGAITVAFDSLVATARRVGLPIDGYALRNWPLDTTLFKYRYRSLKKLYMYVAGMGTGNIIPAHPTPQEQLAMATQTKRADVWVCPALYADAFFYRQFPVINHQLGDLYHYRMPGRWEMVKTMQNVGVGLLLGSGGQSAIPAEALAISPIAGEVRPYVPPDSVTRKFDWLYGDPSAIHHELEMLVGQAKLTPYQALATGTSNVARFMNTEEESGTVAVGKRADLVLLTGNPLEAVQNVQRPAGVMLGGRWLSRAVIDQRVAEMKDSIPVIGGSWPPPVPLPVREDSRPDWMEDLLWFGDGA